MANTLRFKRGLASGIPTGVAGEPLFTTDTFDLYIGNGTTNTRFQKYIASGTTSQYLRGDGSLATFPSLTGFVPYTGATANVDLGVYTILAQNATIASSGSGNTATITHSSGSGIALNITKGGNGEGLYINKTSGTGNAATIIGTLNATTLVKSGGTSTQYLMADGSVSTLTNPITGTGTAGQVAYFTGATTQAGNNNLFWDNTNGRLGIGTNTPSEILHLSGNNSGSTTNSPIATIRLEDLDSSVANNQPIGKIQFWANDTTVPLVGEAAYILAKSAGSSGGAYMTFGTSDATTLAAERMRIDAFGNLLVGGTSVYGATITSYASAGRSGGIGIRNSAGTAAGGFFTYAAGSGSGSTDIFVESAGFMLFSAAGAERMRLTAANGNLHIGTFSSDSGEKLQVTGTAKVTGATSINAALTINTSGQGRTITTFYGAGSDGQNIFIGGGGLSSGTGGGASSNGSYHTAVGVNALLSNTTGFSNTANGFQALYSNTTGSNNTVNGVTALYSNTTGSDNTANGRQAGYGTGTNSNTTGSNNIFIGNRSVGVSATESNRTWIGNSSTTSTWLGGNLLLGSTTDSGEKLQVTGTAKITGATSFGGDVTAAQYRATSKYALGTNINGTTGQFATDNTNNYLDYLGDLYIRNAATSANRMILKSDGGLTIGSTATIGAGALYAGATSITGNLTVSTNLVLNGTSIEQNNASGLTLNASNASGAILFRTAGSERMSIAANGNLAVDSNVLFVDATANEVGIGTNAPNSSLQVVGSVSKSISDVKTANYTATATDYTILCSAASGGFTITLPAASGIAGRIYVIKKTNASSGVNSVTVDGNGAETIDGSASINLACRSSVTLQCDGSNWHILSLYSDTLCL